MPDLAWQIPLAVLITLAIVRLVLTPYWMAKEQEQKTAEEMRRLQESYQQNENVSLQRVARLETQLKDQRTSQLNALVVRRKNQETLDRFIRDGESIRASCKSKSLHLSRGNLHDRHTEWAGQVYSELYNSFGESAAARFRNPDHGLAIPPIVENLVPEENRNIYFALLPQISQLKKFLQELMEKGEIQSSDTA